MTDEFAHLGTSAQNLLQGTDAERLQFIKTAKWIHYPRAESALVRLNSMITYPECARMPCLLVYGDSGIGKTMMIEKFVRDHPASFDRSEGVEHHPVLSVEMPSAPDEKRFYRQLLRAVGAPVASELSLARLEQLALRIVRAVRPRLIIVDEVHNLLAGSPKEQRRALNLLKFIANQLRVCIAALGTSDALHAMHSDNQIASRFEPFHLPHWKSGKEFNSFLATYIKTIPSRKASDLAADRSIGLLLTRSALVSTQVWK